MINAIAKHPRPSASALDKFRAVRFDDGALRSNTEPFSIDSQCLHLMASRLMSSAQNGHCFSSAGSPSSGLDISFEPALFSEPIRLSRVSLRLDGFMSHTIVFQYVVPEYNFF